MRTWKLQDAKARFSELVNRANREGPQVVTRHGTETVVVINAGEYRKLMRKGRTDDDLVAFFQRSPLSDVDLGHFARDPDSGRDIEL